MKAGDRVWVGPVLLTDEDGELGAEWWDADNHRWSTPDRCLPHSDALPAVAACLAKPGFIDGLIATIVRALALYDGAEGRLPELARTMDHDRAVLGDLLAALKGQGR